MRSRRVKLDKGAVVLKNGAKVPEAALLSAMINLRALINENPSALKELLQKCRDPKHKMLGNTQETVEKLGLIDESGSVHAITKNVVLSAVQDDDLGMTLNSPIERQRQNKVPSKNHNKISVFNSSAKEQKTSARTEQSSQGDNEDCLVM